MTHTPGPWLTQFNPGAGLNNDCYNIRSETSKLVGQSYVESDANLIAAAPRLLVALKELADTSRAYLAYMDADDLAALECARAIIAEAEGKP